MSRYEKYKDSGIAWIGEIPEEWGLRPLGIYFDENTNANKNLVLTNALQYKFGEIIRKPKQNDELSEEDSELLSKYTVVRPNDIMINGLNLNYDFKTQRVGRVKEDGIITSAYISLRPRSNTSAQYFNYLLKSFDNEKILNGMGVGIRLTLKYRELKAMLVPAMSHSQQQAIADFLDNKSAEIDELVRLQEVMIEELKAYKQSVITEAVTRGLNPDAPLRDSGIAWIGEIPEHWEVKRLKFAAKSHSDKLLGNENLMYIGLENIVSSSAKYIETKNEYDKSQAISCKVNDVIFGKLRPYLAKALLISEVVCCSSEFAVFSVVQNPNYFKFLLLSDWFVKIVDASTYGAKMPRANIDFINNMFITAPPCAEQQAIADYLDQKSEEIDTLITLKQQKIEQLKEYKKSVIFEYVTGKKRVQQ